MGTFIHPRPGEFFSWAELMVSRKAAALELDNTPPEDAQHRLVDLVANVLDPLRFALKRPIRVTSGYRSPAVNEAVGGAKTSMHKGGEAADIKVKGMTAEELAEMVVELGLPFDKFVWYAPERGGHLHISFTKRRPPRGQMLHAPAGGGYTTWSPARRTP